METKLDKHDIISLQGYTFISNPRKQIVLRKSGGIGIYIKNDISEHISQIETQSDYSAWIKISKLYTKLEDDIIIGACYVPPQNSKYYNEDDFAQLEQEIMSFCCESKYVFITGDLNAKTASMQDFTRSDASFDKYLDLDQETIDFFDQEAFLQNNNIQVERVSKDKNTNNTGYKIIDICKNNNLYMLNGRYGQDAGKGNYTFRDQSVIDYSISSSEGFSLLTDFKIQELDDIYSDGHSLLQMNMHLNTAITLSEHTAETNCALHEKNYNPISQKRYKWEQQKSTIFNENIDITKLKDLDSYLDTIGPEITQENMNEITLKLNNLFLDSAEKTLEKTGASTSMNTFKYDKPWFGLKCKKARKSYNKARKRYQIHKNSGNKANLKAESKHYKNTMNKYINQFKKNQQAKLRKMHKKSPKEYWKYLNSLNKCRKPNAPGLDNFLDFFKDLNSRKHTEDNDSTDDIVNNVNLDNDDQFLNAPISSEEISKCISKLKNSKAPGSDQILNEFIKYSRNQLLPLYVRIFNLILNTGIIPENWVEGLIMPIYKNKGDSMLPENYRPITLLSCMGKLFTAILNERLTLFLDENRILLENQAGFRKHYSTSDHIFVLHSLFELLKKQKKKLFCAFVDFSKAFDSVWRIALWNKLLRNEINGKFFNVIYNLYQNIKSCITLNGANSTFFESYVGLRQGENLSPVLFSIFLNDLEPFLEEKNVTGIEFELENDDLFFFIRFVVLLYADDTAIVCESPDEFQSALNNFVEYCQTWRLNINYDKTKVVIFGARNIDQYRFEMEGVQIEISNSYKYLGVLLSSNGSFLNARKAIYEKANKAMHLLYKRIYNLNLPLDLQLQLFDSTILPIITYGSEIWGYENLDMFERIHNQFLRTITKCRKSTPMYMLYGELGRHPISITIKSRIIGFWTHIINGKSTKFVNLIYKKLLQTGPHLFKWTRNVQAILQEVGRNDIWLNQNENISSNTHKLVKKILFDQFVQKWHNSLQQSSKGRNYNLLKDNPSLEEYLMILPRAKYIPLLKYRTANHFLPVETLRWQSIDISERKCTLCDNNQDTADEFHYLFICKYFDAQRKQYIKPYYFRRPNILKYKGLFSSKSQEKLSNLSKFVTIIMKEFKRQ